MPMQYWDRYERRDGEWFFKSRKPVVFYAADVAPAPAAGRGPLPLPGQPDARRAELPERWQTWQAFWSRTGSE